MKDVSIIGVDLAKNVFQLHGAAAQLQIPRSTLCPTPSFEGSVADLPTCSQFNLVQANSAHVRLLSRNSLWSHRNEGVRKFTIQVS